MALEASSIVHASRHYERAGLRPQAYRASLSAATEASRISARQEAYELYRRAIANMPPDLPVGEQAELYERFSDAAGAIERNEDCVEAATRARRLYFEAGRPLDAAGMLIGMSAQGSSRRRATRRDGGIRRAGAGRDRRSAGDAGTGEAPGLPPERPGRRPAVCLRPRGRSRGRARRRASSPTSVGDRETVLEADLTLARIDIVDGRYETGLRDGMRAAREARDAGFESVGVTGYRNLAIMAARVMDHRSAAESPSARACSTPTRSSSRTAAR